MPFFHRSTYMRQMPSLTPDRYSTYPDSASEAYQQYVPPNQYASAPRKELPGLDGPEYMNLYAQLPSAPQHHSVYGRESNPQHSSSYAPVPTNTVSAYAATNAPLLPPIRNPSRSQEEHHLGSKRTQSAPQPKEEKVVGGVAAHLDYEMEQMADFVAEMAQGMYALYESQICLADIDIIRSVQPNSMVPSAFRKYVLQVLSSTRLPTSTILLGLYYLASRMTMLSVSGRYTAGSGQVYRMLVTSLILGSKFLDDNTFQNRSWSEVSNIPIGELNVLEIEWLTAINWNMHIDCKDSKGFNLWVTHWNIWQSKNLLSPIDRGVQQHQLTNNSYRQTPSYPSPLHHYPSIPSYKEATLDSALKDHSHMQWQTPPNNLTERWPSSSARPDYSLSIATDHPFSARTDYSPPSAPETGPVTPEWYGHIGAFAYGTNPQSFHAVTTSLPSQSLTPAQQSSLHSQYDPQYVPSGWNKHLIHCGCGYCLHHDNSFMASGFGPQPVAG